MPINHWPDSERPREKLLMRGASSLSDAELLAILLGSGSKNQSAIDLGRSLIQRFGDFNRLISSHFEQLCELEGIGPAKACCMLAINEITKRAMLSTLKSQTAAIGAKENHDSTLTSPSRCREYLQNYLHRQLSTGLNESFWAVLLNNQHQVIHSEHLFEGTIDSAQVYPREVIKLCLQHNAAAIIFAHNHPSGCNRPSQADICLTKQLIDSLKAIDVRVLDHFIVASNETVSMAELGML